MMLVLTMAVFLLELAPFPAERVYHSMAVNRGFCPGQTPGQARSQFHSFQVHTLLLATAASSWEESWSKRGWSRNPGEGWGMHWGGPGGPARAPVQFSSVAQSCPTLGDPMNCSTPGLPVHHQLPEFTQTHVHQVSDAIQPSHPLVSPSPPAPNPSQHQSLFQ